MSISSSSVDEIEQIFGNHHQFIEKRTYSSHFCSKTFSNPMAGSGNQNTHKVQDAKKLKVEAHHNNLPYLNSSRLSGVNPFPSPEMRMESMSYQPKPSFLGPRVDSSSSSLSRKNWRLEHSTQEIHNKIRRERYYEPVTSTHPSAALAPPYPVKSTMLFGVPNFIKPSTPLAPPPPAKSTMFFGVPDFFKPSTPLAPPPLAKSTMFFGVPDFFKPLVAPTIPSSDGASISDVVVIVDEEDEEKDLNLDLKL